MNSTALTEPVVPTATTARRVPSTFIVRTGVGAIAFGAPRDRDGHFVLASTTAAALSAPHARARFFASVGLAGWLGATTMGWLQKRSTTGLVASAVLTQRAAVTVFLGVRLRAHKPRAVAR